MVVIMGDIVKCEKCTWSWKIEKDDKHPYLCHKCGFDNKKLVYNFYEFEKWKEEFNRPYNEFINDVDNSIIREFNEIDVSELVWHRDREDRLVLCLENTNWKLQLENELPILMQKNVEYFIPKNVYHRVIKGDNLLKVKIFKL